MEEPDFKLLYDHGTQCIIKYDEETVEFCSVKQSEPLLRYLYQSVFREIFTENREDPRVLTFVDVARKLRMPKPRCVNPEKKHMYSTLFLKSDRDCAVDYIVQKFFTEGIQWVDPNTKHVYRTLGKCLDVFIARPEFLNLVSFRQYSFLTTFLRGHFDRVRILPGQEFDIPPSVCYLIIAPCHTYFRKKIQRIAREADFHPAIKLELSLPPTKPCNPCFNGHFDAASDYYEGNRTESRKCVVEFQPNAREADLPLEIKREYSLPSAQPYNPYSNGHFDAANDCYEANRTESRKRAVELQPDACEADLPLEIKQEYSLPPTEPYNPYLNGHFDAASDYYEGNN